MLTIGDFARLGRVSPRMLRHYDEIDLLRPDRVDAVTGYRLYDVRQLGRLHRIVALRDMGFGLEQIARVEAHLRALEWSDTVELQDVIVKQTVPVRVARATATGLSHADIGAAFGRLLPRVLARLEAAGVAPGITVAVYEDQGGSVPEGDLVLHAGFAIGDRDLPDGDDVHVVDLPVVEAAAATYRGPDDGIVAAWEALVRWLDDSGYRLVGDCRELYHEWDDAGPSRNVMELQQPITR